MAKTTIHTNKENNALLSVNFYVELWTYGIVAPEAWNPLLLISIASQLFRLHLSRDWNCYIISNLEIQKLGLILEYGNHLDDHYVPK